MCKIFFKNKEIHFVEANYTSPSTVEGDIYIYNDIIKLIKEFKTFIRSSNDKLFVKSNYKASELFKDFINCFKIITAGGGLVEGKNADNENVYLYIFRRNTWDLPKGKAEKGEAIEETSIREVMEETGLKQIKLGERLIDTYHFFYKKKELVIKKSIWFKMYASYNETLNAQIEEDITEVRWCKIEEIAALKQNMYKSISHLSSYTLSV